MADFASSSVTQCVNFTGGILNGMPGISICIVHCHSPGLTGLVSAMAAGAVNAATTSRVTAKVRVFMGFLRDIGPGNYTGFGLGPIRSRDQLKNATPAEVPRYGCTHPAKFITPFSILIIATGLMGLRSGPIVIVP